jgi:DNA-binding GntR family transcriptional regulator
MMPTASDKAYALLKQRLVAGSYAPGAQLKEEHIARELGLSRTPVRAALKRLIVDGLATFDAGRSVRVAEWTDADIMETYHLRSLLEAHAAELAAQRKNPSLVTELEQLNRQMAAAIARGGPDMVLALQAINGRFHRAILEASASPRLKALLGTIIDMPIVVRSFFVSTRADIQQSLQHHRDVTDAIANGDGEMAAQAMQLHLRIAARRFFRRRAEFVKIQQATAQDATPAVQRKA